MITVRFRSLESRIVALFLILILLVQLVGFVAIQSGIQSNARAAIREELRLGAKVFSRLKDQKAKDLTEGALILAKDTAFREAFAVNHRETIASALQSARERIGASQVMLLGLDGAVRASTTDDDKPIPSLEHAIQLLIQKAAQTPTQTAEGSAIVDGAPYQIVVVPVKAPVVISWVAMAFPIDARIASDMRELSALQVSILTRSKGAAWSLNASTLPPEQSGGLSATLGRQREGTEFIEEVTMAENDFGTRILPLAEAEGEAAVVVLQRSISEAVAPYRRLQVNLILLTMVGIVVAVLGSFFTARRITGPLRQLGEIAQRLGAGRYEGKIAMKRADEIGALSEAFEAMRDGIASREVEIRRLAYWDTLTGLPNRVQFADMLEEAIGAAAKKKTECYILMMDLNRFKIVNDILGHSFGDTLLVRIAERLQNQVKENSDHVARLGGDEFAILLANVTLEQAQAVAARVLKALEIPVALENQTVDIGAGLGIAGYPAHGDDAQTLLSRAEVAMYAAKQGGGNSSVVYDPRIDKSSQESLSLLSELRHAIDAQQFRLYVQPKTDLQSGAVVALEALVRWVHPERGMVYPDNFIPFSENTGFIRQLTSWMMDRSAAMCRELADQGIHPKISVNMSTRDLLDQDLPAQFAAILGRHGVAATSFCLEITESAIMDDPIRAQNTLEALNAMHFELAIDDFGTGYSSLAYLKRLPVDELKIDKSFVLKMASDPDDAKIVRSTIDLGHNMGLRVVAEGLETEEVWNMLAAMGCDQGQGYFMSRPMPADQFAAWYHAWVPPARALAAREA